jgi:hypothetical protein
MAILYADVRMKRRRRYIPRSQQGPTAAGQQKLWPERLFCLSNAFTSAFKELDPIPQFKATAKLGEFMETRFSQSF